MASAARRSSAPALADPNRHVSNPAPALSGSPAGDAGRLASVDALRGLAALEICLFHFLGRPDSPLHPLLAWTRLPQHGWLGVHAFFVISGFIVPVAMQRAGYHWRDLWRFMLRRVVRLDPPYWLSVLLVIVLGAVLPGTIDQLTPVPIDARVVAGHLFYGFSNLVFEFPLLNSVFWTLAIEFQYYLCLACILPWLVGTPVARTGVVAVLLATALWLPSGMETFLHWSPVFLLGTILALVMTGRVSRAWASVAWAVSLLVCIHVNGYSVAATAALTTAAIWAWRHPGRWVLYLGRISFSLYLLHLPVGGRIVLHFGRPTVLSAGIVTAVALAASIAAADLAWRWVERPALQWASRIRYATPRSPWAGGTLS